MALKIPKKVVYDKVSVKVEASVANDLADFVNYIIAREGGDHVSKDIVVQEVLRDYLCGSSLDVKEWRAQQTPRLAATPASSQSLPQVKSDQHVSKAVETPVATSEGVAAATPTPAPSLSEHVDAALSLNSERAPSKGYVDRDLIERAKERTKNQQSGEMIAGAQSEQSVPGSIPQ